MAGEARPTSQRGYWGVMMGTLFSSIGWGMLSPILPLHASSLGATVTSTGLIVSVMALARVVTNIPTGYLGERFGFKPMVVAGALLFGVSSGLYSMTRVVWILIPLAVFMGVGRALKWTSLLTSAAKLSTPETRGRMMSSLGTYDLLGFCPGPLIGGILADRIGLYAPFVAVVLFELLSLTIFAVLFQEHREKRPTNREQGRGSVGATSTTVLVSSTFILVAFVQFMMMYGAGGTFSTLLPLLAAERCAMSATQIGLAFTVGTLFMVLGIQMAGRMFDRNKRVETLVLGTVLSVLSLFALAIAHRATVFSAGVFMMFLGAGFLYPIPPAYTAGLAGQAGIGRAMGILQTAGDSGNAIGPIVQGFVTDQARGNYNVPLALNAVLSLMASVALVFRVRSLPQEAEPESE